MRVAFSLQSRSGILFHADDVEASDRLSAWRKDPANANLSVAGDDRSPPWTYQEYLYFDSSRQFLCWPSANLSVGLRQAGAQIILKKQKTMKEITQSGLLLPDEDLLFLVDGKQVPASFFDKIKEDTFHDQAEAIKQLGGGTRLFVKRARVGQSKHVRVRLRCDDWTIRGVVDVLAPEITYEALERLFEIAGRIAQGDWRCGCKTPGPYGQFIATLKKVSGDWNWKIPAAA